jgi:alpha-L-fucosidase
MKDPHRKKSVIAIITIAFLIIFLPQNFSFGQSAGQPEELLKKKQKEFLTWKFGMFLHFNMATFVNLEWAGGYEDPLLFNPSGLDCGQWADVAKSAGIRYSILTAKHTGGWCLWDSKYTSHDITTFANFRNGKGDLVREYLDAFRSRGIKVGLYYCLPGNFAGRYDNKLECGQTDLHGLFPEAVGDYEWYIEKQVEELLTAYGKIDIIWFDQYNNPYTGKYWKQLKALVHKIQPECIVIANNSGKFEETDIVGYEYPYLKSARPGYELPPEGNEKPAEVCDILDNRGWFWKTGGEKAKPATDIVNIINLCNSRNSNYLLNISPDNRGLIPDLYVKVLKEVGEKMMK